jgi:hypothetical protein
MIAPDTTRWQQPNTAAANAAAADAARLSLLTLGALPASARTLM